ncbi:MAG TPA: 6-carboxytetrahydropterin synthase [Bryobacteraceae bacterium]|jgi:6-pyruvoyltetrahydropterin/6-carboxytetrahydropterin synthase|nr:6-carboxytetrahydropterin synthase [Bryobacteraceae bacterium]
MTTETHRYRFSASHRLHVPSLSETENNQLFGKCNNPFGHGHDYILSVTVGGEIDAQTGLIIRAAVLDELVRTHVLSLVSHRNLNRDVAHFREIVPTTENLASFIAGLLERAWPPELEARLARVHVQETDRNGFEVLVGVHRRRPVSNPETIVIHA